MLDRHALIAPPGFLQRGIKTLAALRIGGAVSAILVLWGERGFVIPPAGLRFPPSGSAWLPLPASQGLLEAAITVGLAAAVGLGLGWHPRWTATITLACVFYVEWATTLTGKIDHMHHVLWVLAILAVSPCANAWALRRESRSGSARWPATAVVVLLGLIYFGAGLQKLVSAGIEWGWSDNLTNMMLYMSWEKGIPVRQFLIDWPIIGRVLGVGALVFELLFLPLVLWPKTRRWVWPAGLLFHWGTWWILGISFVSIWPLYVVFLPFDKDEPGGRPTDGQRRLIVPLVAAVAVMTVMMVELAYPVAAYPGFQGIRSAEYTILLVDGVPIVETERAAQVSPWRITVLAGNAIKAGRVGELLDWLGATEYTVESVSPLQS